MRALQQGSVVRQATTAADGSYAFHLQLGTYSIEASAPDYESASVELTLDTDGEILTQDFALRTARAEVAPASLTFLVPQGQSRVRTLLLANSGGLALEWAFDEFGGGSARDPTPWVAAFPGDMAYDAGRDLLCQVNVGGDNGIHCWDPDTGSVVHAITGASRGPRSRSAASPIARTTTPSTSAAGTRASSTTSRGSPGTCRARCSASARRRTARSRAWPGIPRSGASGRPPTARATRSTASTPIRAPCSARSPTRSPASTARGSRWTKPRISG